MNVVKISKLHFEFSIKIAHRSSPLFSSLCSVPVACHLLAREQLYAQTSTILIIIYRFIKRAPELTCSYCKMLYVRPRAPGCRQSCLRGNQPTCYHSCHSPHNRFPAITPVVANAIAITISLETLRCRHPITHQTSHITSVARPSPPLLPPFHPPRQFQSSLSSPPPPPCQPLHQSKQRCRRVVTTTAITLKPNAPAAITAFVTSVSCTTYFLLPHRPSPCTAIARPSSPPLPPSFHPRQKQLSLLS